MTTSTAIPTARERKTRTRTTNVSSQPPLLVSQLPPAMVQLTHRAEVLACPACDTWCPLTLDKGTKRWKISPHHTERAGTPVPAAAATPTAWSSSTSSSSGGRSSGSRPAPTSPPAGRPRC
ncbi:hypothetical protein ABTZ03_30850 [Kitasatospora sp. NPDC096077]|uniref:hypothetical protein n=1 Tax=Kitasatospora sp. NPDC096077 TaxID=3155544 RepID=UPI00331B460C